MIADHLGLQGSARRVCSQACWMFKELLWEGIAEPPEVTVYEQIDMLWELLGSRI